MPRKNKDAEYLRELADPRTGICGVANPTVDADRLRRIADRIEALAHQKEGR